MNHDLRMFYSSLDKQTIPILSELIAIFSRKPYLIPSLLVACQYISQSRHENQAEIQKSDNQTMVQ
jgi:hypothetical protein